MLEPSYLSHQFLIAMPALADPNFARTVTYLCEHGPQGALGLIVNRPLDLTTADLLENLGIEAPPGTGALPVYFGGPVHPEQGFVLHRPLGRWQSTLATGDGLAITTSRDILEAMARGQGPAEALIALGYAGWGSGQLEQELATNAWLSLPATVVELFDVPLEQRAQAAASRLGINLDLLSSSFGNA